jgi:hypothetical protein
LYTKRASSVYSVPIADLRRMTSSSLAVTDSSSVRRESELQSIAKRFADSHFRPGPSLRFKSRFTEDFTPNRQNPQSKASFLSRLHFTFSRRAKLSVRDLDGTSMDVLTRPSPLSQIHRPREPTSLQPAKIEYSRRAMTRESTAYKMPSEGDSTLELWQRAVRQEGEQRLSGRRSSSCKPGISVSRDSRLLDPTPLTQSNVQGANIQEKGQVPFETSARSGCDADIGKPISPHATNDLLIVYERDSESFHQAYERSRRACLQNVQAFDEEKTQLRSQKRGSSDALRSSDERSGRIDAWSRFPSHTHAQRNGPADSRDDIVSIDFALQYGPAWARSSPSAGRSWSASGKNYDRRLISSKISRMMKQSLGKLIPTKTVLDGDLAKSAIKLPRSFARPELSIEYPELAILPGEAGYQELTAIERGIKQLKPPSPDIKLSPLAAPCKSIGQVTAEPRSSGHYKGISSSDITNQSRGEKAIILEPSRRLDRPATPAPAFLRNYHDKSSSTPTDRFHTPLSRLSLDQTSSVDARNSSAGSNTNSHKTAQEAFDIENTYPIERQHHSARKPNDSDSIKSDANVVRKSKSTTEPDLRTLGRKYAARGRYGTWTGGMRTRGHINLRESCYPRQTKFEWDGEQVTAPPPTEAPSEVGEDVR